MNNDRNKIIVKTSIIGIITNIVLVLFKMAVGFFANSIAIILDAVNNLSDVMSSSITIIGTKLASKAPDKKHPYGHGRVEYITSVVISVIILLAGIASIKESIEKIIHPVKTNYSVYTLVIISVAIVTKFVLGRYVKSVGKKINSQSLKASGADALFDAVLSFGTLIGAVVNLIWGLQLEGIIGALISIIIIKAGIDMLGEGLSSIIGRRADTELTDNLKKEIAEFKEVKGVYDLTLHNYGPTMLLGSVHIEVDDNMTAKEIHELTRNITEKVYSELGIVLTIGIYASNDSENYGKYKKIISDEIEKHPEIIQVHGFYIEEERKLISFDIIVDFKYDAEKIKNEVIANLKKVINDYEIYVILDTDYSD